MEPEVITLSNADIQAFRAKVLVRTTPITDYISIPALERDPFLVSDHLVNLNDVIEAVSAIAEYLPDSIFLQLKLHLQQLQDDLAQAERLLENPELYQSDDPLNEASVEEWIEQPRGVGRPGYAIPLQLLEEMYNLGCPRKYMASELGVSLRTLERRLKANFGSPDERLSKYTRISDVDLCEAISRVRTQGTQRIGVMGCWSALEATLGILVPRSRVRLCLRMLDPIGANVKYAKLIDRRKLSGFVGLRKVE
ncbi:hypothetical protein BD324DRAFT_677964 [Kockovaella imperatae]|uniref:Uncharacterized protein n=1 Tax=Kockovaella imperatae TaxID=4999 RepID=A0A1Y1URD9_9TREE|nr:hypothetical protein BD324DRAFT_677964 [Kockovaella imperatae]ORX40502.1 hypothetical protein BD324DRAFT_677964 [Kockovaella imperatae]